MANVKQGMEAVAEAHVATLQAKLDTELSYLWTAWGDAATVPLPSFAASDIVAYDIDIDFDGNMISVVAESVAQTGDESPLFVENEYRLRVMVYLISDSKAVIQQQMMRVLRAIQRMYTINPNLDSSLAGYSGTSVQQLMLSDVMSNKRSGLLLQVGGAHVVTRVADSY